MNKFLTVIWSVIFLSLCGCKDRIEKIPIMENAEIPELSIFQIPSQWSTHHGETIEFKDLQGHVLVVVMIYTSCKAACPRLVADINSIESQVSSKTSKPVKYLLVSIDPETDTPERFRKFAKENFMTEDYWLFLTGTVDDVREFANVVAIKYKQISPIDFSHSNIISVFDAQGVMVHQQEGLGVDNISTVNKIIELAE